MKRLVLASGTLGLAQGLHITPQVGGSIQLTATTASLPRFASVVMQAEVAGTPCSGGVYVNDIFVSGKSLRSMTLHDAQGDMVRAGDLVGDDGKAVVIFLRHLG
jgi:hypothetical protein